MPPVKVQFIADQTPVNQRADEWFWDDFGPQLKEFVSSVVGTGSTATYGSSPGLGGAEAEHPGIWNLVSGSGAGANAGLVGIDAALDRIAAFEAVFKPVSSANQTIQAGLYNGSDNVLVELDTSKGDTELSLVKYVGGSRTVAATLAYTAGHWYRLTWLKTGAGAGDLALVDVGAATSQTASLTGLTGSAVVTPQFRITTNAPGGATKQMKVDWARWNLAGMDR